MKEIEAHLERLWAAYCLGLAPRAVVAPTAQKDPALHVMELRGYRGWRVILTEEAVTLQSLRPRYRQAWTPGVQPAAVHTAAHADPWSVLPEPLENDESPPVPHPNCLCGYNAYYRPDIERPALMAGADLRVAGVIRASGVVEMHEAGFRAQHAEILAIAPPRSTQNGGSDKTQEIIIKPSLLKVIADYYNVPWFETWDELVKNFPPTHDVEKDLVMAKIGEPVCRIKVQPIPAPAEAPAQKEIEAHIERVWVAYCSRCTAETLIYRDHIDEAAQDLVNSGWRWYRRSRRLLCHLCERERKH